MVDEMNHRVARKMIGFLVRQQWVALDEVGIARLVQQPPCVREALAIKGLALKTCTPS